MKQAFEVRACRYLIKNTDMKEIKGVLNQIHLERSKNKDIIIKADGKNYIVKEDNIYYIKACGDYSIAYLDNKNIMSGLTLKEWRNYNYLDEKVLIEYILDNWIYDVKYN